VPKTQPVSQQQNNPKPQPQQQRPPPPTAAAAVQGVDGRGGVSGGGASSLPKIPEQAERPSNVELDPTKQQLKKTTAAANPAAGHPGPGGRHPHHPGPLPSTATATPPAHATTTATTNSAGHGHSHGQSSAAEIQQQLARQQQQHQQQLQQAHASATTPGQGQGSRAVQQQLQPSGVGTMPVGGGAETQQSQSRVNPHGATPGGSVTTTTPVVGQGQRLNVGGLHGALGIQPTPTQTQGGGGAGGGLLTTATPTSMLSNPLGNTVGLGAVSGNGGHMMSHDSGDDSVFSPGIVDDERMKLLERVCLFVILQCCSTFSMLVNLLYFCIGGW
jgi:hypothetical protein